MAAQTGNTQEPVHQLLYESILWRGLFFVSSLLLNILFARIYHAAVSGWVFYVMSLYTLFVSVLGFSLESGLGYYAARKEIPVIRLLTFSLLMTLAAGIIVFIFFSAYTPAALAVVPKPFILLSSLAYICGCMLMAYCNGIFYARKDFRTPNITSIAVNVALIVYLLVIRGQEPVAENDPFIHCFFYSFLLQGLVLLGIAWAGKKDAVHGVALPASEQVRKIWSYSAKAFIANLLFFIIYRVDYWFVEKYCTANDLGNYIQVSKLAQLLFTVPSIMASAIFPLTAGGQRAEVNRNLNTIAACLLLLNGLACCILAVTGYWLFPFVYGNSFHNMYLPFLLLIPGILSLSALYPFTAYYAGKNRIDINIKGSVWAMVVIVAGDIIFIPHYGITAAALVSSAGYITYQLYVMLFFKKEYGLSTTALLSVQAADISRMTRFVLDKVFNKKRA